MTRDRHRVQLRTRLLLLWASAVVLFLLLVVGVALADGNVGWGLGVTLVGGFALVQLPCLVVLPLRLVARAERY